MQFAKSIAAAPGRDKKPPPRPVMSARNNPKVHCLFAANRWGTSVHRHASRHPLKRGPRKGALKIEDVKVNAKVYAAAVRSDIAPFMVRTGSKLVVGDCVLLNHCPPVKAAFAEFGIAVFPSAGWPHRVFGGMAPYSHDLSIEDGSMFGLYQDDISKRLRTLPSIGTHTRRSQLYDEIPKLWVSQRYEKLARTSIAHYGAICRNILELDGAPTHR